MDVQDLEIQKWIALALKRMDAPKIKLAWRWNPRLKSTIGRALSVALVDFVRVGSTFYCPTFLEFNPHLFAKATKEERKDAVFHEVAHAVDMCRGTFRPDRPHSDSWKALMIESGYPNPEVYHKVKIS